MRLQLLEVVADFHAVVLTTPNLHTSILALFPWHLNSHLRPAFARMGLLTERLVGETGLILSQTKSPSVW